MRWMSSTGPYSPLRVRTCSATSHSVSSSPPSNPTSPITRPPPSFTYRAAATTLGEFPLAEMTISLSPRR